jgi:Cyclin, N-terminal domain
MGCRSNFESLLATEVASGQHCVDVLCPSRCDSPLSLWREKVAQWCYDVVDHLNEERSVVFVAMKILDRYCSIIVCCMDKKKYEVASLSSLFLAVHLSGSCNLTLQELVSMSRSSISVQDIITEGTAVTQSFSLKLPILAPLDFVRSILPLLPPLQSSVRKQVLLDSASYMTELAVCDEFFSFFKSSSVAIAAILCAVEANSFPDEKLIKQALTKVTSGAIDSLEEVTLLCSRLLCIYNQGVESLRQCGPHLIEDDEMDLSCPIMSEDHSFCV